MRSAFYDRCRRYESELRVLLEIRNVRSPAVAHRRFDFVKRYFQRAKELLSADGLLGERSVVEVWDSLYNTISMALYDESARWGDYRRDVHQWSDNASLYTVDGTYMTERNRLLTSYFPVRTENVLAQIRLFLDIDDFDVPDNWIKMRSDMFCKWDGSGVDAQPLYVDAGASWNIGVDNSNGGTVAGFVSVDPDRFADISKYEYLVLRGVEGGNVRLLANRLVAHGEWKEINATFSANDPYWNAEYGVLMIPLADFKNKNTSSNNRRIDAFVHLDAIKANWGQHANIKGIYLIPSYLRGDANGDGEVNMADAMSVANYILGTSDDSFDFDAADANLDGKVGMADVMFIMNYIRNGKFPK